MKFVELYIRCTNISGKTKVILIDIDSKDCKALYDGTFGDIMKSDEWFQNYEIRYFRIEWLDKNGNAESVIVGMEEKKKCC